MSYKVYLSPSDQTDNRYAYGNTTEAEQCGKIAEACREALVRSGIEVKLGHMKSMQEKCAESNAFGADLHVPIHTNAFNGQVRGTRMFCYNSNGEGMKACRSIFAVVAPLTPGTSENIKVNAEFYEVRVPAAPTAYIECEFHDNAESAKWIIEHTTEIGEAIAHGICNYFGITYKAKEEPKPQPAPAKKTVDELAREVIRGEWGNGSDRRVRLTQAGYDYDAVQNCVNEILTCASAPAKKTVDELAREVIRGEWGNGSDRRVRLTQAGYDYDAVQNRVNEIL